MPKSCEELKDLLIEQNNGVFALKRILTLMSIFLALYLDVQTKKNTFSL